MANNTIFATKNNKATFVATATRFFVKAMRINAIALCDEHNGKATTVEVDGVKRYRFTFDNKDNRDNFVVKFESDYNKAKTPTKAKLSAKKTDKKPTASKGNAKTETVTVELNGVKYTVSKADLVPTQAPKAPSSVKKTTKKAETKKAEPSKAKAPRKTKGVAFDFNAIKGKTNSDKNKALHKALVSMGIADSRTPEYMSVWNARPWAK